MQPNHRPAADALAIMTLSYSALREAHSLLPMRYYKRLTAILADLDEVLFSLRLELDTTRLDYQTAPCSLCQGGHDGQ